MEVSTAGLAAVPLVRAAAGLSCCRGCCRPAVASAMHGFLSSRPLCASPLTCWASALGECCWHHVSGQVEVLTQVLNALVSQEPAAGGLCLGGGEGRGFVSAVWRGNRGMLGGVVLVVGVEAWRSSRMEAKALGRTGRCWCHCLVGMCRCSWPAHNSLQQALPP